MSEAKAEGTRHYRISNVDWRYEMITGSLQLKFPGGTIEIQIDRELQIGHTPLNIIIEVPLYAQPVSTPIK